MRRLRSFALPMLALLAAIALVALLAVVGEIFTTRRMAAAVGAALLLAWVLVRITRRWVPGRALLEVDLARGLVERVPSSPLGRAHAGRAYALLDLVDTLERAARDRRVLGLLVRVGPTELSVARAQELTDALAGFRRSGKPAVAFAETFGELHSGSLALLAVGAACDELYLQPSGTLGITGLVQRKVYLRRLLDKLDVTPELGHRHEYKAAMYQLTEDHMVEPDREATTAYVNAQFDQLVGSIADGRGLDRAHVAAAVDRSPLLAAEARQVGLVDGLLYRDQVEDLIRTSWGTRARTVDAATYLRRARRPHRRGPTIAVIHGIGLVAPGRTRFDPLTRQPSMGADEVAEAFRTATRDKRVKAIVFRIDSPGGSAVASDTIWRATRAAIDAGKPVVATMGTLAGSGGYYVAAGCTKIVAQPGTITGSIGVVGGKLVTRGVWAKVGVTFDAVSRGENAHFMDSAHSMSERERQRLDALLDAIYDDFVGKVAAGRDMTVAEAEALARGRVWAGTDAYDRGLVDALGGYPAAIGLALAAAGLDPTKPYRVKAVPSPTSPLAAARGRLGRDDEPLHTMLQATAPLAELAAEGAATAGQGILSTPGLRAEL